MTSREQFSALKERVLEVLDQGATFYGEGGLDSSVEAGLRSRIEHVRKEEFVVVVIGELNRGKSTFLNALMQRPILSMNVLEATATVGFLRHASVQEGGGEDCARVHFVDQRPPEMVRLEDLKDFTSRQSKLGADTVAERIHHVDVFTPSRFLEDGVLLVDTPGTNTTNEKHIRITYDQIDRSNAAIFLLGANAVLTKSDRNFLDDIRDKIAKFFFVVNRIDEVGPSNVERVMRMASEKVAEALGQDLATSGAHLHPLSSLKALMGRTGFVEDNPLILEDQKGQLEDPEFRRTLIGQSFIEPFEEALEHYLFRGGKGRDLLLSPLTSLGNQVAQTRRMVKQRLDAIDGEFDLSSLQKDEAALTKVIEERKRAVESLTDEISVKLQEAMHVAGEDIRSWGEHEAQAMKDYLACFATMSALECNWTQGEHLANYPQRRLAALLRYAGQQIRLAVDRVLDGQQRDFRKALKKEFADSRAEMLQLPTLSIDFLTMDEDPTHQEEYGKLSRKYEAIENELAELSQAEAGVKDEQLKRLENERTRLSDELDRKYQLLGTRPEPVITHKQETVREMGGGIWGVLKVILVGRNTKEVFVENVDKSPVEDYERSKAAIEEENRRLINDINQRIQAAEGEAHKEQLDRVRAKRLQKQQEDMQAKLSKAETDYRNALDDARARAIENNRHRLLATFRRGFDLLQEKVNQLVTTHADMARTFSDAMTEQFDEQLDAASAQMRELAELLNQRVEEKERTRAILADRDARLETLAARCLEIQETLGRYFSPEKAGE